MDDIEQGMMPSMPSSYQNQQFTEDDEKVVGFLNSAWSTSGAYYNGIDSTTSLVVNFYNGTIPDEYRMIFNPATGEWLETSFSTARIGWTKRAITQMVDEVVTNLFQSNEFFTISPTLGSENIVAVAEQLVTVLLHNAGIEAFIEDLVKCFLIFGEVGVYADWSDTEANSITLERLPYKSIRHLPAHARPDRAVLSYVQYMTKHELLNSPDGQLFNVDMLPDTEGSQLPGNESREGNQNGAGQGEFKVVTSYIPEITIDGETYINTVAVIADERVLLRFETGLSHESFLSRPHIRACREHYIDVDHGPIQIGQSIAHQAIDLEKAGFVIHNLILDNAKQTVHPPRAYDPNDTPLKAYMDRNPTTAFAPAAMVPTSSQMPMHLQPIIGKENLLQTGMSVIQRLEQQYLMTIGIPDFGGGTASDDQRVAATTRSIQANRAALRMKALVKDVNRQIVMPIVHQVYRLVADGLNDGSLEDLAKEVAPIEYLMATEGQQGPEQAPALAPGKFKMAVYESPTVRGERIQAMQQLMSAIPMLLQASPTLLMEAGIELPRMLRQWMRDLGIEANLPLTPPALQAPMQGNDPNADSAMAGQPADAVPSDPTGSGTQPTSRLPGGFPIPGGVQ
jgi:hypothetical protein